MQEHGSLCSCEICRLTYRTQDPYDRDLPAYLATNYFDPMKEIGSMMVYACECRQETIHTSMGVPACSRCSLCGSKFAPLGVPIMGDPEPHNYVVRYDETTGIPYRACTHCYEREDGL